MKNYNIAVIGGGFMGQTHSFSAQKPGWARAHIHSYYTFLSSVFNKTAPSPSFADAAKVQHLIETARKNAEC